MKNKFAATKSFLSFPDFLSLLAGFMATVAMPPYQVYGWVILPSLTLFIYALSVSNKPAKSAFLFSVAHQATLLQWLFFLIPEASISYRWMIPMAGSLVVAYVSLFYLLFGLSYRIIRNRFGGTVALLSMPVLWVGMELLRSVGEMGFPWCLTGASSLTFPQIFPMVSVTGELGLGFLIFTTALFIVSLFKKNRTVISFCGITVSLLLIITVFVANRQPPIHGTDSIRISAVQANVSLKDKWDPEKVDASIEPYTLLTAEAVADSAERIVWAETAVPAFLRYDREKLKWIKSLADSNDVFLYAGFPDASRNNDGDMDRFNGSGMFTPEGSILARYSKHHLLPFGERMPFQSLIPWLGKMDFGQAEWTPGNKPEGIAIPGTDAVVSGLICFESIFSSLVGMTEKSGTNILVNITNDGWFGKRAGPVQHAELARLRSVEYGIPLVRCANNGMSYICDNKGIIIEELPLYVQGVITADVFPADRKSYFATHGYKPLLIVLIGWIFASAVLAFRRKNA
jgi:apolipoprotein N-acyltransferase